MSTLLIESSHTSATSYIYHPVIQDILLWGNQSDICTFMISFSCLLPSLPDFIKERGDFLSHFVSAGGLQAVFRRGSEGELSGTPAGSTTGSAGPAADSAGLATHQVPRGRLLHAAQKSVVPCLVNGGTVPQRTGMCCFWLQKRRGIV